MFEKSFDCVDFQREAREEALIEANYDIKKLIEQVNERLKYNEINSYLVDIKHKQPKTKVERKKHEENRQN